MWAIYLKPWLWCVTYNLWNSKVLYKSDILLKWKEKQISVNEEVFCANKEMKQLK